jgi:hypothetical protein
MCTATHHVPPCARHGSPPRIRSGAGGTGWKKSPGCGGNSTALGPRELRPAKAAAPPPPPCPISAPRPHRLRPAEILGTWGGSLCRGPSTVTITPPLGGAAQTKAALGEQRLSRGGQRLPAGTKASPQLLRACACACARARWHGTAAHAAQTSYPAFTLANKSVV